MLKLSCRPQGYTIHSSTNIISTILLFMSNWNSSNVKMSKYWWIYGQQSVKAIIAQLRCGCICLRNMDERKYNAFFQSFSVFEHLKVRNKHFSGKSLNLHTNLVVYIHSIVYPWIKNFACRKHAKNTILLVCC